MPRMASSPIDASDIINSVFFGQTKENKETDLKQSIQQLRDELIRKYKQLEDLKSRTSDIIRPKSVEALGKALPVTSIDHSLGGGLKISIEYAAMRYHFPMNRRGKPLSLCNNGVIYTTAPIHEFTASITPSTNTAAIRNNMPKDRLQIETGIFDGEFSTTSYSHPHVSNRNSGPGLFQTICYGDNRFTDILDSNKQYTVTDILEFVRRFYIWATHGNLNDMYDSPVYCIPVLANKLSNYIMHGSSIDRLFREVQEAMLTSMAGVIDVCKNDPFLADYIGETSTHLNVGLLSIQLFNLVYAMWIHRHSEQLFGYGGVTTRNSLRGSILCDLVYYMDMYRSKIVLMQYLGWSEPPLDINTQLMEYILSPVCLKEYIEQAHGGDSTLKSLAKQVILTNNFKPSFA